MFQDFEVRFIERACGLSGEQRVLKYSAGQRHPADSGASSETNRDFGGHRRNCLVECRSDSLARSSVDHVPREHMTWRTVSGRISHTGTVRFEPIDDETTRVHVRLSYCPPAGSIGT